MLDPASLSVTLIAPLEGWVSSLSDVPDPVFAERMMGDGVAIDPTSGLLTAPCDGEVIQLHRALHAITLRAANGAEILMHIGLETVALAGEGFTAFVRQGDRVKAGERLIAFDLDRVALGAKSLITPVIITNSDLFSLEHRLRGQKVRAGQALLSLRRHAALPGPAHTASDPAITARRPVVIGLAHGLHARPAAKLADLAKTFTAEIQLEAGGRRVNGRSPVAMMGLGLSHGATLTLIGHGPDAGIAVAALAELIESGMGEATGPAEAMAPTPTDDRRPPPVEGGLSGVRAAPGLRLGVAIRLTLAAIPVPEQGQAAAEERAALSAALATVAAVLTAHGDRAGGSVMAAHLGFLSDPDLLADADGAIAAGKSAGHAWRQAIAVQTAVLRGLADPRFVERVADLADIERQVLVALGHAPQAGAIPLPENAILVAEDLLPSQLVGLDMARLAGIVTARGGPTSHVAILAASMNIPALVAVGTAALAIADGTVLLLDADGSHLTIDPDPAQQRAARERIAERRQRRAAAEAAAHHLCHSKDGTRIEIAANLGSLTDAKAAMAAGAEGCGLLRTEFLFLDRQSPPDEEEQTETYRAIALALEGRMLIIRTLDIGGDKPAAYLPIPAEENPALGLRGVRVSLWRPDLLETQLRAILRGVPAAQCRIMVPMIASLAELRQVRALLNRVQQDLSIEGRVQLGVMVETPAAAVTADILSSEADFLSIGTNDLSQYCLAMDRGNASMAPQIDALHPAVLRLIATTIQGARRFGRWTGVCGGLASDLAAVPILIGLGVQELSVTVGQLPDIKACVSALSIDQCRRLADRALLAQSADEVRALSLGEA